MEATPANEGAIDEAAHLCRTCTAGVARLNDSRSGSAASRPVRLLGALHTARNTHLSRETHGIRPVRDVLP